jgi:ABC-type glycerol-3-phosphate transport system substrate-binding protein
MKRGIVVLAAVLALSACGASTGMATSEAPAGPSTEKLDMPNGAFAVQSFCSHGFRVWQSWHDGGTVYGGNSSVALTSQPDASCLK